MHKLARTLAQALLMTTMITMLAGCGRKMPVEEEQLTIKEGVLSVGVHIGYAPMEYYEGENQVATGFDIELAGLLAEELGVQLELVPCAWDAIFKNMEAGMFDVIISSVSYTKERDEKYALTKDYLSNGIVLVVPVGSDISDITELRGKNVGVQLDTTADQLIRGMNQSIGNASNAKVEEIEISQYENVFNAFEALERGDVDGVCADSVVANYYLVNNSGYNVVWEAPEKEPLCICVDKKNENLRDQINVSLDNLKEQGKLGALSNKYFGVDLATISQ